MNKNLIEKIDIEADLLLRLKPIPADQIFEFMTNLKGGTYFNLGQYSNIKVAKAYKDSFRIYKVLEMTAVVSGVDYENVGTTKEFRQETEKEVGSSWYQHMKGFEHKVGEKKSDPDSKYVLWNVKPNSKATVWYYLVDLSNGMVKDLTLEDILNSDIITASEKKALQPKPSVGVNVETGELVENKTIWRTSNFEHIFWLYQRGEGTREYGVKYEEDYAPINNFVVEGNKHGIGSAALDDILSGLDDYTVGNDLFSDY